MAIGPGTFAGLLAGSASEAVAFGLGFAAAEALRPEATRLKQATWKEDPNAVLAPEIAAQLVAEALRALDWGQAEANQSGMGNERFAALVDTLRAAPGMGDLMAARRRDAISDADFTHGLRKHKLEERWDGALAELLQIKLTPQEVAIMVQRGVLPNSGILPVAPPTGSGVVEPMPQVSLDPFVEAKAYGTNADRLRAMARIIGLPPGPHELLDLLNRGQIEEVDYRRGVAEGNLRNEWADALLHLRRRLITPNEYAELRLRGWIDDAQMHAGAQLSGMHDADTDLLHDMQGRPIPVHQIRTGEARGGTFDGPTDAIPNAYMRSLQEGNIRPEWYNLAYANRYTYPSAFVIRALITEGALTASEAEQTFLEMGWKPSFAHTVAQALSTGSASGAKALTAAQLLTEYEGLQISETALRDRLVALGYSTAAANDYVVLGNARRVASARTSRINRIHTRYVQHKISRAEAVAAVDAINLPPEATTHLLEQWDAEREINQAILTAAQIKRAVKQSIYTVAEAVTLLIDLGYSEHDAYVYLDVKPPAGV